MRDFPMLELEWPEGDRLKSFREQASSDRAEHFKTHLLRRISTPKWETRDTGIPLLADPKLVAAQELLKWGGRSLNDIDTFAFETRPGSSTKFIGVAARKGGRPNAYLIYFRHSARATDYPGGAGLLSLGIGDYFMGRLQICPQLAASTANVAVILPIAVGSSGEFESNAQFVAQCLKEIQAELFGGSDGPLLLAAYSDGIFRLNSFFKNCRSLMGKVLAVYDFDGSYRRGAESITLADTKARVFRYDGANAVPSLPHESVSLYLARTMAMNPARVPLMMRVQGKQSFDRWKEFARSINDTDDLHSYIPSCMLHHGLDMTPGV